MTTRKNNTKLNKLQFYGLMKYTWIVIIIWILVIGALLVRDLYSVKQATMNLATREARILFQKDEAFRFWSATHGGFYVPVSDRTFPSPYLTHIPERDIETSTGQKLTLMNPAWATRQMNEDFTETYGVTGHITSLLPLRLENSPDNWETQALKSFENGESEVFEFMNIEDQPFLRLMQPLVTQEGCLKCHAHQGYKVGDIRGGVSVSIPLDDYLIEEKDHERDLILSSLIVWFFGLTLIILGSMLLKKKSYEREQALEQLKESHEQLENRVNDRTAELSDANKKLKTEISDRKKAEHEIEYQLKEKEIILKEVNHRIKNNFASISSLLSMQADSITHPEALAALQDAIGRVNSMYVLYENLLLSEDYQFTSAKDYLENLIDGIISIFPPDLNLKVEKNINDFDLDPKRLIPVGIIVNELLTNTMKYAFEGRDSGDIQITVTAIDKKVTLIIQDNGRGLPEGFDINEQTSFGLMLVTMLSEQLHAVLTVESIDGVRSTLEFQI